MGDGMGALDTPIQERPEAARQPSEVGFWCATVGALGLLATLAMPWFTTSFQVGGQVTSISGPNSQSVSGWVAVPGAARLVGLAAVVALVALGLRMFAPVAAGRFPAELVAAGGGAVALAVVVVEFAAPPTLHAPSDQLQLPLTVSPATGLAVAAVASLAVTLGSIAQLLMARNTSS